MPTDVSGEGPLCHIRQSESSPSKHHLLDLDPVSATHGGSAPFGRHTALPLPESGGGAGIGPPEHWFETSTDVGKVRPSLISDPANGRVPPLTDAGSKRIDEVCRKAFDDYVYLDPWVRCITRGVPASTFPSLYNNAYLR